MQTVYPSSNHAHHAHNNCVHRNIYQLHYDFKDLIYMRKIASTLETTLGLGYGYTHSLIWFVPCVGKTHACNQENDISAVLSCFLVHILWGVTISKTRKLSEKHTSSSTTTLERFCLAFLVRILWGVTMSKARKLFEKTHFLRHRWVRGAGSSSLVPALRLPPAALDCTGKVCQQRVCQLTPPLFLLDSPRYTTGMLSIACSWATLPCRCS